MYYKVIKSMVALLTAGIILCTGILAGGQFQEEYQERQDIQFEVTRKIAVVNLDDGVLVNGKQTYYAQNMIMLPDGNFFMTSLGDARKGIDQGLYAAYIIVPATFSKSFESINATPIKINLEYELNKNLKASLKAEIVEQLYQFQSLLRENTTYVYVSAILREYHSAQDSSKTVLTNGSKNLKALNNVAVDDLFTTLQHPELALPDFVKAELDVSMYLDSNMEIFDLLNHNFRENLEVGEEAFEYVKGDFKEVEREADRMTSYVAEMGIEREDYESGLEDLRRMIDTHNAEQNSKRQWIKEELASQSNAARKNGQTHVNTVLDIILNGIRTDSGIYRRSVQDLVDSQLKNLQEDSRDNITSTLAELQNQHDIAYGLLENYVNIRLEEINVYYEEQANEWKEQLIDEVKSQLILPEEDEEPEDPADAAVQSLLATFSNATVELATSSDAWIDMESQRNQFPALATAGVALKDVVSADAADKDESIHFWIDIPLFSITPPVNGIELPPIDTSGYDLTVDQLEKFYNIPKTDVERVLEENVINVIDNKIDQQSLELREIIEDFVKRTDDYQHSLEEYDPFDYMDMSFLNQSLRDVEKNIGGIEKSVHEKSSADEVYVDDIYQMSSDNTYLMQDSLTSAYDTSKENVIRTVKELQSLQEGNHSQDTELLEEFTKKLQYTRVGSVENKAVYDFIVNPVSLISGDTAKPKMLQFDSEYRTAAVAAMAVLGGITVFLLILYFAAKLKHWRSEGKGIR